MLNQRRTAEIRENPMNKSVYNGIKWNLVDFMTHDNKLN